MKLVNLTPHTINVVASDGTTILAIEPSGDVARVSSHTETTGFVTVWDGDGAVLIPVTATVFGDVQGLPDPQSDVAFVVSSLVAQRVPDRDDVFIPSDSVRDNAGRIIGCRSLGRI
jgi:hypothetical protein